MLIKIVDELNLPNVGFSEATRIILGERAVFINRLFIIIGQWGCCASYMLFFVEFFENAIYHTTSVKIGHEIIYLLFAMCIILPMTLINNLSLFVKLNAVSNV